MNLKTGASFLMGGVVVAKPENRTMIRTLIKEGRYYD
jgi:hypothetical protein